MTLGLFPSADDSSHYTNRVFTAFILDIRGSGRGRYQNHLNNKYIYNHGNPIT